LLFLVCSAAAEKLKILYRYPVLAPLSSVLSGPGIEGKSAFDEQWPALAHIFIYIFRLTSERPAIYKAHLTSVFAVLTGPPAINSQPEIDNRRLAW
jgi:hypothetical protein